MTEKTTPTPPSHCVECGQEFECATDLENGKTPKEGAISVCFGCAALKVFNANLTLRPLTDEEWSQMHPESKADVLRIQRVVRQAKAKRVYREMTSKKHLN